MEFVLLGQALVLVFRVRRIGFDLNKWRTDRASQKELNEALERATSLLVARFDLPEARALIHDRYFYEREQFKAAIRELAAHPFDQDAVKTVERVLSSVMPDHPGGQQADAVRYFLQCLLEGSVKNYLPVFIWRAGIWIEHPERLPFG